MGRPRTGSWPIAVVVALDQPDALQDVVRPAEVVVHDHVVAPAARSRSDIDFASGRSSRIRHPATREFVHVLQQQSDAVAVQYRQIRDVEPVALLQRDRRRRRAACRDSVKPVSVQSEQSRNMMALVVSGFSSPA